MSTLDVHKHVIPAEVIDLLDSEPSYGVAITDGHWLAVHHVPFPMVPSFYEVAAKLQRLDRIGIDAAVISAPPPLFFYEEPAAAADRLCRASNEGFARFCTGVLARLRWIADLRSQAPDLAVASYRDAAAARAAGAALGTSLAGRRLDDPEFELFWAIAGELELPVLLHPAFNEPYAGLSSWYLQNVIGNPLETTVALDRLLFAGTLHRHAEILLILLHGGGFFHYQLGRLRHARRVRPELADTEQDLLAPLDRLYSDTITHDLQALRFLLQQIGEGHVVLGTDMPFDMTMQDPMSQLRAALPDEVVWRIAENVPNALFAATPAGEAASSS